MAFLGNQYYRYLIWEMSMLLFASVYVCASHLKTDDILSREIRLETKIINLFLIEIIIFK